MISRTGRIAVVAICLLGAVACADDVPDYSGAQRNPQALVGDLSLPDVGDGDAPFAFDAPDGEVLVVYFGYTRCPDVCPTTMSDLATALGQLEPDEAEQVEFAMVTVDPDRDLDVITEYVQTFIPDGHGLGTNDQDQLREVADGFGASYGVETAEDGEVEVSHSAQLYAVDDTGHISLEWLFGTSSDDIAKDLSLLLEHDGRVVTP